MDDDKKLTYFLYAIAVLSIIAIIGIWEVLVEPVIAFADEAIEITDSGL